MKTLIIMTFLVLNFSQAGTLTNKSTGEEMAFNLDEGTRILTISSTSSDVPNQQLELVNLKMHKKNYKPLMTLTHGVYSAFGQDYIPLLYVWPVVNVVTFSSHIIDVLALPVKGIKRGIESKQIEKDYSTLMKAITSDLQISISDKKFNRIEKYFN